MMPNGHYVTQVLAILVKAHTQHHLSPVEITDEQHLIPKSHFLKKPSHWCFFLQMELLVQRLRFLTVICL